MPGDSDRTISAATSNSSAPSASSLYARFAEVVAAGGLWLMINAVLWYCLLEVRPFKSLPPIPVGVAGIFANFYIIPLARKAGARTRRRLGEARTTTPFPT